MPQAAAGMLIVFMADAAKIRQSFDLPTADEIMSLPNAAHKAPNGVIERAAKFSIVN
jgi:hypothetical protein